MVRKWSTVPISLSYTTCTPRAQALAAQRTCGDVGMLAGAAATGALADQLGLDVALRLNAALLLLVTSWFGVRGALRRQAARNCKHR
jgi:predicted MFS family arabinose efflux permease